MTLQALISNIEVLRVSGRTDTPVLNLRFDSRLVEPGDLFFAIPGATSDGHEFISKAIGQGAASIICERYPDELEDHVCYVEVKNSHQALGVIASAYHGHPSRHLQLVGVTGTNGKTTTATLLYNLFIRLGYGCGLISTIRNMINRTEVPATHTTPDPVQLNALLSKMVKEGCQYCFMEVSSHAIDQQRIAGLFFAGGIFTNLTHDHLDYHKTFDAYLKAKKAFFDGLPSTAFALYNKDDRNGAVMVQNSLAATHDYSVLSMAEFKCRIIENQFNGLLLDLDSREVWFKLVGQFNAFNLLAVYATAVLLNQDPTEVLTILSSLEPVDGRFNYIRSDRKVTAVVDYAHTPDALKNVLETINGIREHQEKLITVVGAGGNRDSAKRPVMARIACMLSDQVILTSDNPRNEDPGEILGDMSKGVGVDQQHKVLVISDRKEAIKTACALAKAGDIILVAGKGHETYQEIKGVRYHFDDREILESILKTETI